LKEKMRGEIRKWIAEEDATLVGLVKQYGAHNWNTVSSHFDMRTATQCRQRWVGHLCPNIRRDVWTVEEEEMLLELLDEFGPNKWYKIKDAFFGRTEVELKNHYTMFMRYRPKADKIDSTKLESFEFETPTFGDEDACVNKKSNNNNTTNNNNNNNHLSTSVTNGGNSNNTNTIAPNNNNNNNNTTTSLFSLGKRNTAATASSPLGLFSLKPKSSMPPTTRPTSKFGLVGEDTLCGLAPEAGLVPTNFAQLQQEQQAVLEPKVMNRWQDCVPDQQVEKRTSHELPCIPHLLGQPRPVMWLA